MRRECECRRPNPYQHPEKADTCVQCSGWINPEWSPSNQTVAEFFDRLAEAMFDAKLLHGPGPPEWWEDFRRHAEVRELAGRKAFGYRYCDRDNPRESQEEVADYAIYAMLAILRSRREGNREEWELALTGAYHAAEAHRCAAALRAHRHEQISDFTQD